MARPRIDSDLTYYVDGAGGSVRGASTRQPIEADARLLSPSTPRPISQLTHLAGLVRPFSQSGCPAGGYEAMVGCFSSLAVLTGSEGLSPANPS